ncbi:hypothetical protein N5079_16715 [Planotetraspora sp. A-T 1434]|uniref:hypothetical protein n=1 Tax=Planotetraspora sp. A-T 1434 TaxID=2979219 RepID=UPI0021BEB078|nr:hypothetical protein [Planotetraspora sp. A-T 1434]MCT9931854.1 hypothetical protein [Planotetraspora sp. A-T 1434]
MQLCQPGGWYRLCHGREYDAAAEPIQPIAAADVAAAVSEVAAGAPLNGIRNVAGPEVFALDDLGRITLKAKGDSRFVVTDDTAGMFAGVKGDVITAPADAIIAPTRYADWLATT